MTEISPLPPASAEFVSDTDWYPLGRWAVAELSVGHVESAFRAYRVLCAVNPEEDRWHIGLCLCAVQLGRAKDARLALSRVRNKHHFILERYRKRLELLGDGKSVPLSPTSSGHLIKPEVLSSAQTPAPLQASVQGSVIPFPKKPSL